MLKLINTTKQTLNANDIVALNLDINTNSNLSFNNNAITINRSGIYEINAIFNIVATDTTSNITLYANGVAIPETSITLTTTAGDSYEIVINDIEKVIKNYIDFSKVNLTFVSTSGVTISNANVSVKVIK